MSNMSQEQQEYSPLPYGVSGGQSNDLVKWQLTTYDLLDEIEHRLRGEVFNHKEGKYEKKFERLMTEEGINKIMNFLFSYVDKNSILTNFTMEDVRRLSKDARNALSELLAFNFVKWELNKGDLTMIVVMIDEKIYAVLRRAFNDGERRHLNTVSQRSEIIRNDMPMQEYPASQHRGGIMGFFGR